MNRLACLLMMLALVAAAGCNDAYVMRGRVVQGPITQIAVVRADDPRLAGPGIADATLLFTLEPRGVDRQSLGYATSDEAGEFQLPVDRFLAGFLEYPLEVSAQADKFQSAAETIIMPPSNKRVLVTLAPGRGALQSDDGDRRQIEDDIRNFGTR